MKHLLILVLTFSNFYAIASNNRSTLADTTEIANENVLYKFSQDGSYVYLNISTSDKKATMTMLRNGITVYYDIKGKEKKNVYVKYPYSNEPKQFRQGSQGNNNANAMDLESIIENLPKEAEYGFFEEKEVFNKMLNTLNITIKTNYTPENQLFEYSIKIPKYNISTEEGSDFSKLSIGVVTNKMGGEVNRERGQGQNSGMRSGGGRGGSGAGRGGNRGGGMGRQNGQQPGSTTTNDFWFEAK